MYFVINTRIINIIIKIVIYFSFNDIKVIRDVVSQHGNNNLKLEFREDLALQFQQIIEPLLLSSLGSRISELSFYVYQESVSIGKVQEPFSNFLIGLKLNTQRANIVVERGPTANLPEVVICTFYINNEN